MKKINDIHIKISAFLYIKVQVWKGCELRPEDYGWSSVNGVLVPDQGFTEICPKDLALTLKCGCKKSCSTKSCSCRKSDVDCTEWCKCSNSCQNQTRPKPHELDSDSSMDEEFE